MSPTAGRVRRSIAATTLMLGGPALGVAAVTLLAPSAVADPGGGHGHAKADRPGNNGTIKIDGEPFDDHPGNEPHPGCLFQVDLYNYGEGDFFADVTFSAQPPTTSGSMSVAEGDSHPYVGEDPPGGGTDLDADETYRLSFTGEPHPQQGYHVKLTVHAPRSLGADTKHKVFWVEDCEAPAEAAPTHSSGGATKPDGTHARPEAASPAPARPAVAPSRATRSAPAAQSPESAAVPTVITAGVDHANATSDRGGPGYGAPLLGVAAVIALATAAAAHRRRGAQQT